MDFSLRTCGCGADGKHPMNQFYHNMKQRSLKKMLYAILLGSFFRFLQLYFFETEFIGVQSNLKQANGMTKKQETKLIPVISPLTPGMVTIRTIVFRKETSENYPETGNRSRRKATSNRLRSGSGELKRLRAADPHRIRKKRSGPVPQANRDGTSDARKQAGSGIPNRESRRDQIRRIGTG